MSILCYEEDEAKKPALPLHSDESLPEALTIGGVQSDTTSLRPVDIPTGVHESIRSDGSDDRPLVSS